MVPFSLIFILFYAFIINSLAFIAFSIDKYLARNRMWRISESSLLLLATLGGTIGALIAQHFLRHKTRKQPFKTLLYFIAISQFALIVIISVRVI